MVEPFKLIQGDKDMADISPRQILAREIERELRGWGAGAVISPLPLHPNEQLRVHIPDSQLNRFRQYCADQGLPITVRGPLPRFTPNGPCGACVFEVNVDKRAPILDDCEPPVEVAKEATAAQKAEVVAMKEAIYGKDRRK
jgi:hypothetical protein